MEKNFDVIVIGAGSIGLPIAYFLSLEGVKVLVLEAESSVGQGQNKAAIGGVRATHSDPAKILLCQESLKIFSRWEETYSYSIGWKKGGYCFPVYREKEEVTLKSLLPIQKNYGLNIDWIDADAIREIIPGINTDGLIGGIYSPDDGQVSPLLAAHALYKESVDQGCTYHFKETVNKIKINNGTIKEVSTNEGVYSTPVVVNAAGAYARQVGAMMGLEIPVTPDSHEAGISAPMEQFLGPLIVDMRPGEEGKTDNFYFGQNHEGPIIFCYTPSKLFTGTNRESTAEFLPILAKRVINLIPRLKNMLIRRVWRGLYPMTPDGLPICGKVNEIEGLYLAVGMCGQGFMMGPGIGKNMACLIVKGKPLMEQETFDTVSFYRDMYNSKREALK